MRVYKISPILKYSPFFDLTYISSHDFEIGDIVEIDFNKRKIFGIALEAYNLKDAKVEIRKSDFFTKKIEKKLEDKDLKKFSKKQFETLRNFSLEFGLPLGEVIYYLFGENIDIANNVFEKIFEKQSDFNFEKYFLLTNPHISRLHLFFVWLENFASPRKEKYVFETNFIGVNEKYFLDNLKKENKKLFEKIEIVESEHKAKKFLVNVDNDEIINAEVLEKIKSSTFVFVLEQAYASRVFCNDCKASFDCENCSHAYSVIHEKDEMYLFCKNCKNKKILKKDQYLICRNCGSWKVLPFGTGVQKVKEFLVEKGFEVVLGGRGAPAQGIAVGSIKDLNKFLEKKKVFDTVVVASLGPLVKGKNFDSDEKLIYLISKLENISKEIYINKRSGDELSLGNFKNKEKFLEEELEFRKISNLPPYSKVISLIFNYRNKKVVDKFLSEDKEKYTRQPGPIGKISGEAKKGNNFIYYWFTPPYRPGDMELYNFCKILRSFGEVIVSNTIVEQIISGKK
jgi:primosomal protein N'